MKNLIGIQWTGGRGCFVYADGYVGWRWVVALGPLLIFVRWHNTKWWQNYRDARP